MTLEQVNKIVKKIENRIKALHADNADIVNEYDIIRDVLMTEFNTAQIEAAQQVLSAVKGRVNELQIELDKARLQ